MGKGKNMTARIKDGSTRREFVKEVAGTAFACTFVGLDTIAAAPTDAPENKEKLVAPCGLYCGACPMYLATQDKDEKKIKELLQRFSSMNQKLTLADLQCDGCIGGGRVASFCLKCGMRDCAEKKQKVTRCADCKEFPCSQITNFNNDGMQHHAEVLANCRQIREVGIKEWTKREEERWSCPQCRAKISWYDKACPSCGAKRSDKLFPLKQG
jgi:hypothetical protein